eukprot:c13969_g1_i4.p1 GENE.c13969_g1_i4~~c13969_g1_i4.p1  ORF type:complete len:149 (+),score=35.36 c13969_g1_i4:636-1082(+)
MLPTQLCLKSIGYVNEPLRGLPFDAKTNRIPNELGKVLEMENVYVTGWAKRGPTGIIGTNLIDATQTVEKMLGDLAQRLQSSGDGGLRAATSGGWEEVHRLLVSRGVRVVDKKGWRRILEHETEHGKRLGKVREKILLVEDMLRVAGV